MKTFDTVFKNKLKHRAYKLKKDTTTSIDDKVKSLQQSVEKFCDKVLDRLNNYFNIIFKQISIDVENMGYQDMLDYVKDFDTVIYDRIIKKISTDRKLTMEDFEFQSQNIWDDIIRLVDKFFKERIKDNEKREQYMLNKKNKMDVLFDKFRKIPESPESIEELKRGILENSPYVLNEILKMIKAMVTELKTTGADEKMLKTLLQ